MTGYLPLRPSIDRDPRRRTVIDLTDDAATDVLGALSSETAHTILEALADGPATASELAARVDSSLQNVLYHLENLCETDAITPVSTWYSSKGREMTVYALTSERLEIRIGTSESAARTETQVSQDTPSPLTHNET